MVILNIYDCLYVLIEKNNFSTNNLLGSKRIWISRLNVSFASETLNNQVEDPTVLVAVHVIDNAYIYQNIRIQIHRINVF